MQTKLTLRMEQHLIEAAKKFSRDHEKSLSRIVADYFRLLSIRQESSGGGKEDLLPPHTRFLSGLLRESSLDEQDYRDHLEEKHR